MGNKLGCQACVGADRGGSLDPCRNAQPVKMTLTLLKSAANLTQWEYSSRAPALKYTSQL